VQEKLTKKNLSVAKMFQILEVMAKNKGPMRLQDISTEVQHPASTVLRMLNSLMSIQYIQQDQETLRYSLSFKFCRIGDVVRSQFSIQKMARPYLMELSEICHESACLALEQDMSVVYIDTVEGPDNMLRTLQRIGKVAPMHSTGVGKLLLTNYDRNKLDTFIKIRDLEPLTSKTITTFEGLLVELEKVREQGYALDDEECEIGVRCVAAPIKDYTGNVVACISVSGPTSRINKDRIKEITEKVLKTAEEISNLLGYSQT
jgi:DNA-binding IclR family transcriptional regulator